jgi:DNA polymerase I-like protein with 3'-5' exonuclease and polymerase domains
VRRGNRVLQLESVERFDGHQRTHIAPEVRDKGISPAFHDALVSDARTIFRLAEALPAKMDEGLCDLYQRLELPLMLVLDGMRRTGIGIDGDRARAELQRVRQDLGTLDQRITSGVPVDLSSNQEVFRFLIQKGVQFSNPFVSRHCRTAF